MATIKSFTSLEQSKKLAEILPLESADMCYLPTHIGDEHHFIASLSPYSVCTKMIDVSIEYCTPCWSLASLLNYLKNKNKFPEIKELSDGRFKLTTYIWDDKDCIQVSIGDSIVDACYEMIIHLNELNLL